MVISSAEIAVGHWGWGGVTNSCFTTFILILEGSARMVSFLYRAVQSYGMKGFSKCSNILSRQGRKSVHLHQPSSIRQWIWYSSVYSSNLATASRVFMNNRTKKEVNDIDIISPHLWHQRLPAWSGWVSHCSQNSAFLRCFCMVTERGKIFTTGKIFYNCFKKSHLLSQV